MSAPNTWRSPVAERLVDEAVVAALDRLAVEQALDALEASHGRRVLDVLVATDRVADDDLAVVREVRRRRRGDGGA